MGQMTYAEAARLALREELSADPRVWALGEDLGPEGGVAGQYRGLQEEFGPHRIVDTPISENTIMGAAVGAAVAGSRPVVELRYCDFGLCAADEIINQAAKIRYMTGGQARAPLVVRQSIGMRAGAAAHHSQSTEALWVQIPGLVVVAPATPADNRALLKAAIRSEDPVVFLEHKELWATEGEVPDHDEPGVLGQAQRRRHGDDLTIVSWSKGVILAEAAADQLQTEGTTVDLIDLRTLYPWDAGVVLESVEHTGRLLVVHESGEIMGFGAEVVAVVARKLFGTLRAPPARIGVPHVPIPFSEPLEDLCRVTPSRIADAARELVPQSTARSLAR
jgi:acetoin:2,6-dichlorophenolindophenol oxidoreductase subunit beta